MASRPLIQPHSENSGHGKRSTRKRKNEKNDWPKKKSSTKLIDDAELKELESIVFGSSIEVISQIDSTVDLVSEDLTDHSSKRKQKSSDLFLLDRHGDDPQVNDQSFIIDRLPKINDICENQSDDDCGRIDSSQKVEPPKMEPKPKWFDEDDQIKSEEIQYKRKNNPKTKMYKDFLEKKFLEIHQEPSWVKKAMSHQKKNFKDLDVDSDDDDDEDDIVYNELKRYATNSRGVQKNLDENFLSLKKCKDLNAQSRVSTSLNCIDFHPHSTVALVGAQCGLIRLFQVDGNINALIQSIYFKGYAMSQAKFISANGREEIIVGSDGMNKKSRGCCYYYDMIAGKIMKTELRHGRTSSFSLRSFELSSDGALLAACQENGNIMLLSTATKEHVAEIKMNGEADCLAFSPDSHYILAHGRDNGCQAYVFDVRNVRQTVRCINRFYTMDTIECTRMAISPDRSIIGVGSNMGIVNVYRFDEILNQTNPEPIKTFGNLTTSISSLTFNHDNQLMMMASSHKSDSARIIYTKRMRVYKNFTGQIHGKKPFNIYDARFSPNSGYFSMVKGDGYAYLYRINHYQSY